MAANNDKPVFDYHVSHTNHEIPTLEDIERAKQIVKTGEGVISWEEAMSRWPIHQQENDVLEKLLAERKQSGSAK